MYVEDQPTTLPAVPRIVVIGDIHGDIGRFMQVMYTMGIVSPSWEWTAEPKNTIVVQMGDQLDSKPRAEVGAWESLPDVECMRLIDSLDALAVGHGGRVLSLLGNHELMNVLGDFSYVSQESMARTGGATARAWSLRPGSDMARNIMAKRNIVLKIGRQLFCHGGLVPMHLENVNNQLHRLNDICRKFLRVQELDGAEVSVLQNDILGANGILWTRAYMELLGKHPAALEQLLRDVLTRTGCTSTYVGHTTLHQITPIGNGALWFVDAGFSRAYPNEGKVMVLEVHNDGESFRTVQIDVKK